MKKLEVFDPAMCCPTGVCGPGVDPNLVRFATDLEWLRSKGIEVNRFNLAQDVAAFTQNSEVKRMLNAQGTSCLPVVLVDGSIVATGTYPSRSELAKYADVEFEPGPSASATDLVGISLKRN